MNGTDAVVITSPRLGSSPTIPATVFLIAVIAGGLTDESKMSATLCFSTLPGATVSCEITLLAPFVTVPESCL